MTAHNLCSAGIELRAWCMLGKHYQQGYTPRVRTGKDPEASFVFCPPASCVYSYHLVSLVCDGTGSVGSHHLHPTSSSVRETVKNKKDDIPATRFPGSWLCRKPAISGSRGLHPTSAALPFCCTHRVFQSLGSRVCTRAQPSRGA